MHWFFRAAIAAIAGVGGHLALAFSVGSFLDASRWEVRTIVLGGWWVISYCICVAVYDRLTRRYSLGFTDAETRCRKCGYILQGISEPRCPDCAERI